METKTMFIEYVCGLNIGFEGDHYAHHGSCFACLPLGLWCSSTSTGVVATQSLGYGKFAEECVEIAARLYMFAGTMH
jgi:hypothetical protein